MNKNLFETVYKALALAMGVAVIVLSILGNLSAHNGMMLLGIGLAALGLSGLEKLS